MFKISKKILAALLAGTILLTAAGCSDQTPKDQGQGTPTGKEKVSLIGAGATFPHPLYSKMFEEYRKVNSDVTVNYQAIGSGGGIKQISEQTVQFGATDAPMTESEEQGAKGGKILHIPATIGATAVAYNLPAVKDLKLSPEVLADIYLGKITKWNDSRIKADNPNASLPDLDITVAYRSDGSGTTFNFSDYMSSISSEWKEKVGTGKSLKWPVGVGGKGNSGVAGVIKQAEGAIGYVELAYATHNNIQTAVLKNKAGNWVAPSLKGASAAAAGAQIPEDMKVSIVNADGADAYPIATFTWLLIYQNQTDKAKGQATVELFKWMITEGQAYSEALDYAKLPSNLVEREIAKLKTVTFNGEPLLK